MRPAGPAHDAAAIWDIAVPARPGLPGVSMAGFRQRGGGLLDLQVVPYPAVTVVVDLSGQGQGFLVVDEVSGRQQGGNVVAGLGPGCVRARGQDTSACRCGCRRRSPTRRWAPPGC